MTKSINSEVLFDLSFEHSSNGKALLDIDGKILKVNPALCELFKYPEHELLTKTKKETTPEDIYESDYKAISKLINNETKKVNYKSKCITSENEVLDLEVTAIAFHGDGEDVKLTHILKEIENVSVRENLQKDAKCKQFFMEKVMEEMPAHIYFKDLESKFLLVNNSMVELFKQKSVDDLIGKSDFDFFDDEHAKQAYDDEQGIIESGKVVQRIEKEVWPSGKVTWAHSTKKPLYSETGELIGTFGISKDITETKKAEKALQDAHNELSIKNKELNITLENLKEAQTKIINSEKLAALGQLIAGIAHEINTPLGAINASNSNILSSFELLIEQYTTSNYKFNDEERQLMIDIFENYKNNKELPLNSREKRKVKREISDYITGMGIAEASKIADTLVYLNLHKNYKDYISGSNSINTASVVKVVKNMISLLKNSENIRIAIEKASSVVMALKKYVHKTHDGNKSKTDIADNIETVLTLNYNKIKQGVEIIRNYDDIPFIDVYPDEISQVWNNLITNSIHAMSNKGTITIDIIDKQENVIIKFSDTGCGIPEDIKDKIFTPFFTTKISGEGTGLGLDIIKKIVEKHHGILSFESEVGKGTTFTIQLPKN